MRRITLRPRDGWQREVEHQGLIWHSDARGVYWDESAAYAFGPAEIETIETASEELHELYREAGHRIASDERLMAQCGIPAPYHAAVSDSWRRRDPALDYGRFDLGYAGDGPPKLFEYNCDTPTAMLETAIVQWAWKEDVFPHADQFNSLHEKLRARWQALRPLLPGGHGWFAHVADDAHEDSITATYMREIAQEAGVETHPVLIEQIGVDGAGRIVDQDDYLITALFKLYPWEWIAEEVFGSAILPHLATTIWLEPAWKMLWSNKGVLAVLWDMFPGHPNLLPAAFTPEAVGPSHVVKPVHAREGANIRIMEGGAVIASSGGAYDGPCVYQARYPLRDFGHGYPVLGSWVVAGEAAGLGIREDGLITANAARFIPHIIEE